MSRVINQLYEFGNFRLDPVRRLLSQNGALVPLKPKVFDTLLALVASCGRVVEKEELLREVWGSVAVEEIGLTKNISTLRKALGESPDEHRYIVTVPGRGYRFVANVTTVSQESDGPIEVEEQEITETPTVARVIPEEEVIGAEVQALRSQSGARRGSLWLRVGIPAGVVGITGVLLALYFGGRAAVTNKESILLADFVNRTGDPVFDETLQQGLAVQLEQSRLVEVFPEARVRQTLRLMGRSPDDRITREIAREICQRQGLKAFIAGSIAPLGSHYVITMEAIAGRAGTTLARAQVEAGNKEQVLRSMSEAASRLRRGLGESLGSIRKQDALLERTTTSLEALRAYSLGSQQRRKGKTEAALAFFRQATELDPSFAYAYSALAVAYRNAGQPTQAAEYTAKAYALRDRLSEHERFYITSLYHEHVTGDIGKNIEALQLYQQLYPQEALPHNNLAVAYRVAGQAEQAVKEARIAMRLDPGSAIRYGVLGSALIHVDRFEEASQTYRRALDQSLDDLSIHRGLYRIALVNHDTLAMERQLDWAAKNSNEHEALDWQSEAAAFSGRWRVSAKYARQAVETATRNGAPELAAIYAAESALRGAALGQCGEARAEAAQTQAEHATVKGLVSVTRLSLALALCGESGGAQSRVAELKARYPQNTIINWVWLPAIEGTLELLRGNAEKTVNLLQPAARYEAAAQFWPQYLRGQAYLRLGKGTEAAAEFRKILDHRGQAVSSPLYPLAHLGLARAMDAKHDAASARKSVEALLSAWRDADSDLPVLVEARREAGRWK